MTQPDRSELNKFAELVGTYGARPEAWPEAERARARALLEASPEARRIAAGEAGLDRWLDSLDAPPPGPDLEARVLAAAPAFASARRRTADPLLRHRLRDILRRWRLPLPEEALRGPVLRPVYAAACAAVVGLMLGWGGLFSPGAAGEEEEILAIAFVGSGLESYDLGDVQ